MPTLSYLPARGQPTRSHDDMRQFMRWYDQHGRPYTGTIEIRSRDFCGCPPQPEGWAPPFIEWNVPAKYFRTQIDPMNPQAAEVDFDAWIRDARDWMAGWFQRFMDLGRQLNGDGFDPKNPGLSVVTVAGPRPIAPQVVLAMKQGNRSALGWDPKAKAPYAGPLDPRLVAFQPERAIYEMEDFSDADFSEPAEKPVAKK